MPLTENTRLALIDTVRAALSTRAPGDLKAAMNLLRVKCNQSKTDPLVFLFDEVFQAKKPLETDKTDKCPYCDKQEIKGVHGLKTHISRVHPAEFKKWKSNFKNN